MKAEIQWKNQYGAWTGTDGKYSYAVGPYVTTESDPTCYRILVTLGDAIEFDLRIRGQMKALKVCRVISSLI